MFYGGYECHYCGKSGWECDVIYDRKIPGCLGRDVIVCRGPDGKNDAKLLAADKKKRLQDEWVVQIVERNTTCGNPAYLVVIDQTPKLHARWKAEAEAEGVPMDRAYWSRGSNLGIRPEKKASTKKKTNFGFSFDFPSSDINTIHEDGKPNLKDRLSRRRNETWRPTRERYWRPPNNNWKRKRITRWRHPGSSFKMPCLES